MANKWLHQVVRESIGNIAREIRISLTPVPSPDKWVFLVGCYNSGTTLLAELLGLHSKISALPTEGHFITDQFTKDFDVGLPRMWVGNESLFRLSDSDIGPDPNRIKREWGMRLDLSKPVLLEKSPPNSARTLWLQKHFENAHFIVIVRNGYAVAEGISRKGDPKHLKDGWPIEDSIWQWKRGNQILFEDIRKLEHVCQVKYEDLTTNTAQVLEEITQFLCIEPFDEQLIKRNFQIHERQQSIVNLNEESISRLKKDQINKINEIAGDALADLGYEVIRV